MLKVEIRTDVASFQREPAEEAIYLLNRVCTDLRLGEVSGPCFDSNGDQVGKWELTAHDEEARADLYLVWSNEHRAWWGPGASGYTTVVPQAGRYTREQALHICRSAQGGWNGAAPAPEYPILERDALDASLGGRSFG